MSFNNVGPVTTISPGATHYWWFTRNGGANFGEQHGGADVKTPGAQLVADNQGKKIENNGTVSYHLSIRNADALPALYNLQGGGSV
ncbi:MAG: hypothetical protein M3P00_10510 [Gemmatimonadota bacterium]|jgi:hypothetical protein|nr:hypothetical protein [Gemmatimonadota bacterium]